MRTFVQELLDHCYALEPLPQRHPLVRRYARAGIRRAVHGNYLIFYRISAQIVGVVHILHGARDYESILAVQPGETTDLTEAQTQE